MAIFPSEETAYDALNAAHWISCYPFVFQSVICLLRGGVLAYLDETPNGASFDQIGQKTGLSQGALKVLLQAAVYFDILNLRDGLYSNTKTAHFLLTDKIVKANLDFAQDVCYLGLFNLLESLKEEKPIGLETLGQAETIYPILSTLNEPARTSWYTFDHCYSDKCFSKALDILLSSRPSTICDIGGNTGLFEAACCQRDSELRIMVLDLPEQCAVIRRNMLDQGFSNRVNCIEIDLLSDASFPQISADAWWLSQFLDCFSSEDIVEILRRVASRLGDDDRVYILEPFVRRQPFPMGDKCLAAFSLYFTAIANGKSRFYSFEDFSELISRAGLKIDQMFEGLGTGHTLLVCKKAYI